MMPTRVFHLLLILSLLLPGHIRLLDTDPDLPYRAYLAVIANGSQPCQLIHQSPKDGDYFAPGTVFDTIWILQNNSAKTWQSRTAVVRFISGDRLQTGADSFNILNDVGSGERLYLDIKMRAPTPPGSYAANWSLVEGTTTLCKFHIEIRVQ